MTPNPPSPKLRWALAFAVLILVGAVSYVMVFVKVGPLHYRVHQDELGRIVKEARALPLVPGLSMYLTLDRSEFDSGVGGAVEARQDRKGRFIVIIKRPGYLKSQGYIYVGDPSVTSVKSEGFPLWETREYERVDDRWWSYRGLKF